MNIVITGSLGYDYIMDFSGRFADRIMPDNLHKISLSFLAERLNKQYGGTAGNIGYTLSLLGTPPTIVSIAGNDFAPYKAFLDSHDIDTGSILVDEKEPTSCYFVVTDKDDNQIGSFYVGAQKHADRLRLPPADFYVVSPQDPATMKRFVSELTAEKKRYLFDPAFQIGTFSKEELLAGVSGAELLIGNDYEIDLLTDTLGISHEELLVSGPKAVITTLGAKGSIIETRTDAIHCKPAKATKIVDPTGAGDAYRGGFLAGYMRNLPLDVCGQMGSVASVYTVEKYGTVTHEYTKEEFIARYTQQYKTDLLL